MNFLAQKKTFLATLSTGSLILAFVIGQNVGGSQSNVTSSCVNKKSGILRISSSCTNQEQAIQLNVLGAQDLEIDQGLSGEAEVDDNAASSLVSGSGAPGSLVGKEGDFYIDSKAFKIYGPKKNDSWGSATDLVGPAGANGTDGTDGANGTAGANGEKGDKGEIGSIVASGISKAYFRILNSDFLLDSDADTVVGRISGVPAGKYLVFFNTDVLNWGLGRYFGCGFVPQPAGGAQKIYIEPDSLNGGALLESRYVYAKNGLVTVDSEVGTIDVHCKVTETPTGLFALLNGSMVAIALNDVTTSERVWKNPSQP